jgi:hypothetical protein
MKAETCVNGKGARGMPARRGGADRVWTMKTSQAVEALVIDGGWSGYQSLAERVSGVRPRDKLLAGADPADRAADFERERHIFVDMLHNHDLLHLRDLPRPILPEMRATPSRNSYGPDR